MMLKMRCFCLLAVWGALLGVAQAQVVLASEGPPDDKVVSEVRLQEPESALKWAESRGLVHARLGSGVAAIDLNDAFGIQKLEKRHRFTKLLLEKSDRDGMISVPPLSDEERKLIGARFVSTNHLATMLLRATEGELELYVWQYLFLRIGGEDYFVNVRSSDLPEVPRTLRSVPIDGLVSTGIDASFLDTKQGSALVLRAFAVPQPLSVEDVLSEAQRWFEHERNLWTQRNAETEDDLLDKLIRTRGFVVTRSPRSRKFSDLPETLKTAYRRRFLENFRHNHFKTREEANAALDSSTIQSHSVTVMLSLRGMSGNYNEVVFTRSAPEGSLEELGVQEKSVDEPR